MEWVLCIAGCLTQTTFILVDRKGHYHAACILKGSASAIFTLLGFMGLKDSGNQTFATAVCFGLLFGAIGDIGMHLRLLFPKAKMQTMAVGVLSFLIGHLLYLKALIPLDPSCLVAAVPLAAFAALIVCLTLIRKTEVKNKYRVLGAIYMSFICLMVMLAICLAFRHPEVTAYKMYAVGAVLFVASDIIMSMNLFLPNSKTWYRPLNLGLYYVAQLLIALTVYYI